jgi:hypothetical protein
MCTGIEIAALAGTAMSVGGSLMGGRDAKKAGKLAGEAEFAEALVTAKQIRREARRSRSATQAGYAGAGIDVSEGTPLIADTELARLSEEDALNTILMGSQRRSALKKGGQVAQRAGQFNAATTALSAYGNVRGLR